MTAHMQKTKLNFYPSRTILITFFVLGGLIQLRCLANELNADSLLTAADSQFNEKSYQQAATNYQQLFDHGWYSPSSLLRFAWIKENSGQPEEATFALYKYFLITEDQGAYNKVLELTDKYHIAGYQLSESAYIIQQLQSFKTPLTILLILTTLALTGLTFYHWKKNPAKHLNTISFTNLGVLTSLFLILNFTDQPEKAIIDETGTYMMNGPSAAAGISSTVSKGDLVTIRQQKDVWVRVSVDGKEGWVREVFLRKL